MASLSLKGTLKMENKSIDGALLRISQALRGVASSLQEFQEVETLLGLESAGEADCRGTNETGPNFLRGVAGTLKEMVGKLVSDIEAKPEIQKLLMVIQESISGAANEGATIAKQGSSCIVETVALGEAETACTSAMHSRTVRGAAVAMGCRHFCAVHLEVMDPYLWNTLPVELVQFALARLPIAKLILDIYANSAWSVLSRSPNFRQVCFERHPKLFGLMVENTLWQDDKLRNVVYDIKSNEWINRDSSGFHRTFGTTTNDWLRYMCHSKYACYGGLVCFVPETMMLTRFSIRIGSPLIDQWKALSCMPSLRSVSGENWQKIMEQLVTEEDTKCYKVILVFGNDRRENYAAQCYDSKTGAWSYMESGLVYGNSQGSLKNQVDDPRVFDCTTKTMYKLVDRTTRVYTLKTAETMYRFVDLSADPHPFFGGIEGVNARRCVMVKDRLFVLHELSSDPHDRKGFQVSEYAWQSNTFDLRIVNTTAPQYVPIKYKVLLSASGGSIFLLVDKGGREERHRRLIRVYDSSATCWHILPSILPDMGDDIRFPYDDKFRYVLWCEQRWDAVP